MAKLRVTIELLTTDKYDAAVQQGRPLKVRDEGDHPAYQLGNQIARVVASLGYVKKAPITVEVSKVEATVESGSETSRQQSLDLAETSVVLSSPAEKRRAG